ncbi:hypothetical protein B0T20DRAFT_218866 [Sordaria brevicollis]|uniref:Uncharacterized protein n=1 Tax=Sordaria brevicollis TaxID=83679 RepID=A0AAE0PFH9_SORBR|nr:hypothetical protein B0T20DRAFT_218866 [Sordaria brevicollis]
MSSAQFFNPNNQQARPHTIASESFSAIAYTVLMGLRGSLEASAEPQDRHDKGEEVQVIALILTTDASALLLKPVTRMWNGQLETMYERVHKTGSLGWRALLPFPNSNACAVLAGGGVCAHTQQRKLATFSIFDKITPSIIIKIGQNYYKKTVY